MYKCNNMYTYVYSVYMYKAQLMFANTHSDAVIKCFILIFQASVFLC